MAKKSLAQTPNKQAAPSSDADVSAFGPTRESVSASSPLQDKDEEHHHWSQNEGLLSAHDGPNNRQSEDDDELLNTNPALENQMPRGHSTTNRSSNMGISTSHTEMQPYSSPAPAASSYDAGRPKSTGKLVRPSGGAPSARKPIARSTLSSRTRTFKTTGMKRADPYDMGHSPQIGERRQRHVPGSTAFSPLKKQSRNARNMPAMQADLIQGQRGQGLNPRRSRRQEQLREHELSHQNHSPRVLELQSKTASNVNRLSEPSQQDDQDQEQELGDVADTNNDIARVGEDTDAIVVGKPSSPVKKRGRPSKAKKNPEAQHQLGLKRNRGRPRKEHTSSMLDVNIGEPNAQKVHPGSDRKSPEVRNLRSRSTKAATKAATTNDKAPQLDGKYQRSSSTDQADLSEHEPNDEDVHECEQNADHEDPNAQKTVGPAKARPSEMFTGTQSEESMSSSVQSRGTMHALEDPNGSIRFYGQWPALRKACRAVNEIDVNVVKNEPQPKRHINLRNAHIGNILKSCNTVVDKLSANEDPAAQLAEIDEQIGALYRITGDLN